MARTQNEIKKTITEAFMLNSDLAFKYGFTEGAEFEAQFSLLSIENIYFEIVAFAMWIHEQIFEQHKTEVTDLLYNQKNGRLPWYRYMALRFQYGFDLLPDSDVFDNSPAGSVTDIEDSKLIKYAAVVESQSDGRVILKIAGETDDQLAPLSSDVFMSVDAYFKEIRPAGVKLTIINYEPDQLFTNLRIYYDPLVLTPAGRSILNGNFPVEDAIREFMRELPFNGEFINASFIDKLQAVEGVVIPHILFIESSWIDPAVGGYGDPEPIDVKTIPESGYFTWSGGTTTFGFRNIPVPTNGIEYVVYS